MMPTFEFVSRKLSCLRVCLPISLLILAALLLPATGLAQVTYTGTVANQNLGTQAIGSTSAAATFSFSVTAGTTVGSIAVVTQGAANLDFNNATGGTCTATTYASTTTCTVNVTFAPKVAGLLQGAIVFFSGAGDTGTVLGRVLIYGTGTGPQITFVPSPAIAVATGPAGALALDSAGDLFIAEGIQSGNSVAEVPAGGGAAIALDPTVNGKSLSHPFDVVVDGAGDLFIADTGNNRVVEVPVGGGAAIAIDPVVNGAGLYEPVGVAVDAAGDLFVADGWSSEPYSRVVELPAGGGAGIAFDPVVNGLSLSTFLKGVAVDAAGNIFISDYGNNRVVEIPAGGGAAIALDPTVNGLSVSGPIALRLDGVGNLFISDYGNNRVVEIPAGGGAATVELSVKSLGVAVGGAGNLFAAEDGGVEEFERSQPQALSFPTPTQVGTPDTTDGKQTVQIQNVGNETLTLTALSYPLDFSEAGGDSSACTPSTSLNAGQQCDVPVEFTPKTDGSLSENVTLTDNALNVTGAEQSIAVTGTGEGANHLSVTTTAAVAAGIPFTITITGLSASNKTVTTYNGTVSFNSSDPGFVNPGPLTLSSGVGQATVTLKTIGTQTITATDTLTPSLTGTGSFAVASAPPPPPLVTYTGTAANQNFGSQAVGSTSAANTFSFSVAAGTTVGSIGVLTTGIANLDFAIATGSTCTATTYASASTCTVNVTFTPKGVGVLMGAVVFFSGPNKTGTVVGSLPVYGVGTGPLLAFGFGAPLVIAQGEISPYGNYGIYDPTGLATNAAGDVFWNCCGNGGLAFDGAGDLFSASGDVVESPVGGGASLAIDPVVNNLGLSGAAGVTVDATGDLFIADSGNNRVVEVPAGGGAAVAIAPTAGGTGLNNPTDVKLDAAGDLFIADQGNNRVVEVPAGGGAAIAIGGVGSPNALALDVLGDLFIVVGNEGQVVEVPAGGGAAFNTVSMGGVCASAPNPISSAGIAMDSAGDLFVSSFSYYYIYDPIDPPGDYFYYSFVCEFPRSQPPALNFPTATNVGSIDTTDGTQTVQIQNIGNQALNLAALSYPADFPQASGDPNPCPVSISLSAGQSCDIPVELAPKQAGALRENVTFTENSLNVTGTRQSIAVTGTSPVAMTSPVPGSTLAGSTVPFAWTPVSGAAEYDLLLGLDGAGSNNLYNSGATTATSAIVTGLPLKGATIYARLFYEVAGVWQHLDYTYTEATSALATMISPAQGATLGAPSATFTWNAGSVVTSYALWLGLNGVGSSDLYNSGHTSATSVNVAGLPENGVTIYARLFSDVGGEWQSIDYTYTEATAVLATMSSPTSGSTLGTSNVTFTWMAGYGVTSYQLWLGLSGPGSSDLYSSGHTTLTTATVPALPAKGATVYARLYSEVDGQWKFIDYTYTEQ